MRKPLRPTVKHSVIFVEGIGSDVRRIGATPEGVLLQPARLRARRRPSWSSAGRAGTRWSGAARWRRGSSPARSRTAGRRRACCRCSPPSASCCRGCGSATMRPTRTTASAWATTSRGSSTRRRGRSVSRTTPSAGGRRPRPGGAGAGGRRRGDRRPPRDSRRDCPAQCAATSRRRPVWRCVAEPPHGRGCRRQDWRPPEPGGAAVGAGPSRGRRTPCERRGRRRQNRTSAASCNARSKVETRLQRSIHACVAGEIHPVTSRMIS